MALPLDASGDITDTDQSFALTIRHGATEFSGSAPTNHQLRLAFDTQAWAELLLGKMSLAALVEDRRAQFSGNEQMKAAFLEAYHEVF